MPRTFPETCSRFDPEIPLYTEVYNSPEYKFSQIFELKEDTPRNHHTAGLT